MEISNQEYSRLVQARVKPSPLWRDVAWAFGVGGAICVLGQALLKLVPEPGTGPGSGGDRCVGDADFRRGGAHRPGVV